MYLKLSDSAHTWFAVVDVSLTLLASVTRLAFTLVATHSVMANPTIAAWALHTFVDVKLTCLTLKKEGKSVEVYTHDRYKIYIINI